MSRQDEYRARLQVLDPRAWDDVLIAESALPGPRANLELAQAAANLGDERQFERWLGMGPAAAPEDSARLFLPVCGAIGLGRLVADGRADLLPRLREAAGDPRWRVREAVVLGLQRLGDRDASALVTEMSEWARGGFLEQRAAVAAVCEPRLLREPSIARSVMTILDHATTAVQHAPDRRDVALRVLRQSLGYCWSVLVAAQPAEGKAALERWAAVPDPDVQWIVRENLKKARLRRMDADWVDALSSRLFTGS